MSAQITCLGGVVEVGDAVVVSETFTAYPSTGYGVTLYLSLNGTAATNVAGTGGTLGVWSFTLTSAVTTNLSAGKYDFAYYATATSGGARSTARTGQVTFIPNLAVTTAKSPTQIMLDALNATILALSGSPNSSVSFNGQSFTKRDLTQLMAMRRELEAQVDRENKTAAALRGVIDDGTIRPNFGCGPIYGGPFYRG